MTGLSAERRSLRHRRRWHIDLCRSVTTACPR